MGRQRATPYGKQIKKRLIDLGRTQTSLAEELGIAPQYLTMIIDGRRSGKKYRDDIYRILQMPSREKGAV